MQRLKRVTDLVNDGFDPEDPGGEPLLLRRSPVPYRTHLQRLPDALAMARELSYFSFSPEDGFLIEVYDTTNPADLSLDQREARCRAARHALGWHDKGDLLSYSMYFRRLRDRRNSFSSLAPVALFPLPSRELAELMMGRFDMIATLSASGLERRLAQAGIEVEVARGSAAGDSFMRLAGAEATVIVPAPLREQIQIELMSLETLTETLSWYMDDPAARGLGGSAVTISHADEAAVWTAHP